MHSFTHVLVVLLFFGVSSTPSAQTFQGEISDSQCALNVHSRDSSHKDMIETNIMGSTSEECARTCVRRNGGKFVLLDKVHGRVYRVDPQTNAEKFAGKEVVVRGTYDKDADLLRAVEIKTRDQMPGVGPLPKGSK